MANLAQWKLLCSVEHPLVDLGIECTYAWSPFRSGSDTLRFVTHVQRRKASHLVRLALSQIQYESYLCDTCANPQVLIITSVVTHKRGVVWLLTPRPLRPLEDQGSGSHIRVPAIIQLD